MNLEVKCQTDAKKPNFLEHPWGLYLSLVSNSCILLLIMSPMLCELTYSLLILTLEWYKYFMQMTCYLVMNRCGRFEFWWGGWKSWEWPNFRWSLKVSSQILDQHCWLTLPASNSWFRRLYLFLNERQSNQDWLIGKTATSHAAEKELFLLIRAVFTCLTARLSWRSSIIPPTKGFLKG